MPCKSKAMVYLYLQRKLQRKDLASLRGQFVDTNSGKETRERFSLKELVFNRRVDSLSSAKTLLKETCPEGVSQTYMSDFERKKKEVVTMVKSCEDRVIKLYAAGVSRAGMKCKYLLCSLELSSSRYIHEVFDKEYPKELVSEIESILVTPVECELSGGKTNVPIGGEKIGRPRKERPIFADRLVEGVRPRKVYEIFGRIFDNRHLKVELFARCANLKSGWVQIGLEVDPLVSDKAFGCLVPEGLRDEKINY
eukprot:augustus_masked-scaffold_4-processed-gene-13.9-mRNA-1 protein AED:1.00 eAED:1.00 QI:0/0/0/0/1/1/2/0/251